MPPEIPVPPPPSQPETPEVVVDAENGETPPESEEAQEAPSTSTGDPDVDTASRDEVLDERSEIIVESGFDSIVKMIAETRGEDGHAEMMDAATKECMKFFNGIDESEARNRVENVDKFLSVMRVEAKGVDLSEQETSRLQQLVCEPILRGRLSAESMRGLATIIQVRSGEELKQQTKDTHGYEGIMWSDGKGHIVIAKEALTGEWKAPDGSEMDIRHMVTHEESHTAVEDVFYKADAEGNTEAVEAGDKFSKEVIALAQQAKENRVPQSRHIETVLDMLGNIESDYNALPEETRQQKSLDTFREERENLAAKEILTDYTAIYLQSDGTRPGFMGECISKIDQQRLFEYLTAEMPADTSEAEIQGQLSEILKMPVEQKKQALESNPRFARMNNAFKMYDKFYDIASKYITDDRIKAAAAARDLDSDFDFEGAWGDGGYWDAGMGGKGNIGENGGSKQENLMNAAGQAFKGFAEEVNVLKSVSSGGGGGLPMAA